MELHQLDYVRAVAKYQNLQEQLRKSTFHSLPFPSRSINLRANWGFACLTERHGR